MFGQLKKREISEKKKKKKRKENLFGKFDAAKTKLYTFYKRQMEIIIQI